MYESARKYFESYVNNNYDLTNAKIMHKFNHTFYVVDNAKYICEDLKLSDEDKELAMLIALLHDIGRFDQAVRKESFREDIIDYDHAKMGAKLLFDDGEIRKYIKTNQYDDIIRKAVENHNKYILEESNLTDKELLHCKIIRDADKLDCFRTKASFDIYMMANISEEDIKTSLISKKVYDDFMSEKTILSTDRKTAIDVWISYIAFVFGLEFKSSLKIVKEKDYINILFNRFNNILEKDKMELLRGKTLDYIDEKLKN